MSKIKVKSAFILRRDTAENWKINNPILKSGEEGYEIDTGKRKVGDGITAWNFLVYTVDQTYSPNSENAQSGLAVAVAVDQKLDKPKNAPEVGKFLKVNAVNEDGTFACEWAEVVADGVKTATKIADITLTEETVKLSIDMQGLKPAKDFNKLICKITTPKNSNATNGVAISIKYTDSNDGIGIDCNGALTAHTYQNTSVVTMDIFDDGENYVCIANKGATQYNVGTYSSPMCGTINIISNNYNSQIYNNLIVSVFNTNVYPSFPVGTKIVVEVV